MARSAVARPASLSNTGLAHALRGALGIAGRSLRLIPRQPSTFVPSLVMPVFFTISFSGQFSGISNLPDFPTSEILNWFLPFTMVQGGAFAGLTAGLGIARDLENGFYDRFLSSPVPRWALLLGALLAAMARAALPLAILTVFAFLAGIAFPGGVAGMATVVLASAGIALVAGAWGIGMALRFKTMQAAPLIQSGVFIALFLSTAHMPLRYLTGWLHDVASVNPITETYALARQGFLGEVTWDITAAGLLALAIMLAVTLTLAARGMARIIP